MNFWNCFFFSNRIKDVASTHKGDGKSVYLTNLLRPSGGVGLKETLQINFMVDFEWLWMNYEVVKIQVKLSSSARAQWNSSKLFFNRNYQSSSLFTSLWLKLTFESYTKSIDLSYQFIFRTYRWQFCTAKTTRSWKTNLYFRPRWRQHESRWQIRLELITRRFDGKCCKTTTGLVDSVLHLIRWLL